MCRSAPTLAELIEGIQLTRTERPPRLAGVPMSLSWSTRTWSIVHSIRGITRLWFDILAPLTMVAILVARPLTVTELVVGGAVILCAHLGATLISDSSDVDVDAASVESSRSKRVLVTGQGNARDLMLFGYLLLITAVSCAFYFGYLVALLVFAAILLALAYSVRPLLLSSRPIWPQLIWPVLWLIMYTLIAHIGQSPRWQAGLGYAVFVALFMGVGEGITQDVHDLDNDTAGGRRTTPGVYGLKVSLIIAIGAQFAATISWLVFCLTYPMPVVTTTAGSLALAGWVAGLVFLSKSLIGQYSKTAARWTHYGSICIFSAVNVLVIISVLASAKEMGQWLLLK